MDYQSRWEISPFFVRCVYLYVHAITQETWINHFFQQLTFSAASQDDSIEYNIRCSSLEI